MRDITKEIATLTC